ncbi:DUF4349 domain-containing protein [Pseudenhygromyxa sp. WMMC2535]|uniref:DUF4349 domain-containing protein n=1 Tax=Pseudenhygromyxa sp. WMMC2535 TaxID=2712867 RepID=UPI001554F442|nr:DUF4349 domain-containing protein [Pseudenhygromyxa sp. WMMC2535]NVB39182.1 DUF4349 domain-containing protein [Pseudenhygromyxa sp. WMMC2535]
MTRATESTISDPRPRRLLRGWTLLAVLLMVFGLAACKPGYGYGYESYPGGGGGGGGGMDGPTSIDEVEYAEITSSRATRSRAKRSRMVQRDSFAAEESMAAPPEPSAAPEAELISVEREQGANQDQGKDQAQGQGQPPPKQASARRFVVYTAQMQIEVYDREASVTIAEQLPARFGGWLQERRDTMLVLRIPAEHLEEVMAAIGELGVVTSSRLQAEDVTAEYTDLESRIRVLEETQAQLQLLLDRAKNVEQALEVRKALDQVTMELEVARARMRELSKSVAFSTLTLHFFQRGPEVATPSSNDPFRWVDELGVEATEYR